MTTFSRTDDLAYLTATQALDLFKQHELSPVELLEAQLAQVEAINPKINAVHSVRLDIAREQAKAAERAYMSRSATLRPLEGIPTALKNEHALAGELNDIASFSMLNNIPEENSAIVQSMLDAGAIFHIRTHVPEFCLAGFGRSLLHGISRNPWNTDMSPGGSSTGSGMALATGMTSLATGSDIGGSIRIPSSQCGVVGLKASFGRVPEESALFALHQHTHNGIMARSVADSVLGFNIVNGPHRADITTIRPRMVADVPTGDVRGMRIALSYDLGYFNVADDVRKNTARAAQMLRDMGAIVDEVQMPWDISCQTVFAHALDMISPLIEETIRGHEHETSDYILHMIKHSSSGTLAQYAAALEGAGNMHLGLQSTVFDKQYDALLCPTMAQTDTPADGPEDAMTDVFRSGMTYPFNTLSRYPVLSVPSGFADNGVPTGLQIVGQTYCEPTVFQIGAALEKSVGWLAWRPKL